MDLGTGVDRGVGHTARAPEGREGRYQAGPKARRAPRLLVINIVIIINLFVDNFLDVLLFCLIFDTSRSLIPLLVPEIL